MTNPQTYQMAMRMVKNRRSKYALVDLVNWLLVRPLPEKKEDV